MSSEEWLLKRQALLQKEKELSKSLDGISAQIRDLGMVPITKKYTLTAPNGDAVQLVDLFEGRQQLIIYHFMFAPEWEEGCSACSFVSDHIPHLSHLNHRDTTYVAISRAPIEKINAFKERMGWSFPWYSSYNSDFNYDFHATQDEAVRPVEYNYEDKESLDKKGHGYFTQGETHTFSVLFRKAEEIFHAYSTYARGADRVLNTYSLLDMTPFGRQGGPSDIMTFPHHDKYDVQGGLVQAH